jgi:23S rRNA (adenine2503-C2)-methyltransferase
MDIEAIKKILEKEPAFRLKQIKKAIFQDLIENWSQASTLPQSLRDKLPAIISLKEEKKLSSKDNRTIKVLFKLEDGLNIESVLMRHEEKRNTVCVSSQAGCAMNCKFCATGQQGFKRNLSSEEIIDQVLFFARLLKKEKEKITNVVFMGMGEPMLNYDNVLESIKILNDKDGFNIGSRKMSISTSGITEGIKKLADENLQVNLAVSLHASNNELRSKLMPINNKYPIEKILSAVDNYIEKTNRRVMFEYLMIDGINDSEVQAKELAKVLKENLKKQIYFVNLISFNPIGHSDFKPSPNNKIKSFKQALEDAEISATLRYRFGQEIDAACGQLATNEKQ